MEDVEVTIDDLPPKLSGLSKETLNTQISVENAANADAVFTGPINITDGSQFLAGDPTAIKEPGQQDTIEMHLWLLRYLWGCVCCDYPNGEVYSSAGL